MEEFVGEPIPSEDALWELLARIVENPAVAEEINLLRFVGWNPQLLYFPDEYIGHSVRPSLARAITEFHSSLSKAYALVVYGQPNRLLLKKEDRDALEMLFVVTDGSSGLEAVAQALDRLTAEMVSKLSGPQVMGIIILVIVLFFGKDMAKEYYAATLEQKADQLASEERIKLSEQETERFRLFREAMEKFGVNPAIKDEADDALKALTRPAAQEDHSRVRGVDLTKHQAQAVLSSGQKEREGRRLDGNYRVIDINTDTEMGYAIKLQDVDTEQEFTAYATYEELTREDIHTIFEVAEKKSVVHALVNAFFVGDRISRAFIVRAYIESDDGDRSTDDNKTGGDY